MVKILKSAFLALIVAHGALSAGEAPREQQCFRGESFDAGCGKYPAGYNAPAAFDLKKSWSGYVDASFIYWYAAELGLYLGEYAILNGSGTPVMALESFPLFQPLDYKPGFKVGVGATYNGEWTISGEYTWFRGTTQTTKAAPANTSAISGQGVWVVDDWFQQTTMLVSPAKSLSATSITGTWKLAMDLADLDLSRPYYEGSNLTVLPFAGLRAAWIRQTVTVELEQAPASEGGSQNLPSQPIGSRNNSNSWAIGPRVGCEAQCLLPLGFRLEANGSASLLATCFTKIAHSEDLQAIGDIQGPYRIRENNHYLMTPNVQLGLGLGWGTYSYCRKYHFDCSATYDFLEFWNENVIRRMLDNFWAGIASPAGDLFFHGLTLKARFDF